MDLQYKDCSFQNKENKRKALVSNLGGLTSATNNLQEVSHIVPQKCGFIQPLARIRFIKFKTGGILYTMENLINVSYENDRITVSARELHEFLEIKSKYADWFKNMVAYGFEENVDYRAFSKNLENGGRMIDHEITISMAKEVAMIQRTPKGSQVRKYFIECEKIAMESTKPISTEDALIQTLQLTKQIRLTAERAESLSLETKEEVSLMRDVISLSPSSWRKGTSTIITRIAQKLGGNGYIQTVREESYRYLEERAHVALSIRLSNKRKAMAENGVCKSKRDKLNKLDIINEDPKVLECYLAIVKEMAIKYGITIPSQMAVSLDSLIQAQA